MTRSAAVCTCDDHYSAKRIVQLNHTSMSNCYSSSLLVSAITTPSWPIEEPTLAAQPCVSQMSSTFDVVDSRRAEKFEHEPLRSAQAGLVRLIRLQSTSYDQCIQCSIACNMSIADTDYSAVSYEWGDPTAPRHDIVINNKTFSIQQNLYDFLHSLVTQGGTTELLWIDALCIDQQNTDEKNHQVAQMGQIYQNATNVLIWLGPTADESDEVFDFIENLHIPVRNESSTVDSFQALTQDDWNAVRLSMYDVSFSKRRVLLFDAVRALCNRTFWMRQWVLQEILLARNAVLFCGVKRCKWLPFLVVMDPSWNVGSKSRRWQYNLRNSLAMPILKGWTIRMEASAPETLQNLLLRYHSCRCTDPRDKVYALLSLAESAAVPVDYGLTAAEVFSHAFDTFEDALNWEELQALLSSIPLSLDEFLTCYVQLERGKKRMKQVAIGILNIPNFGVEDAEPFMTYNQMCSPYRGAVSHKQVVQPPSRGTSASHCTSAVLESTEFFVFSHPMWHPDISFRSGGKYYPLIEKDLRRRIPCKVCECNTCSKSRQTFLELSNYQRASSEYDLSESDHYVWSFALKTIHFFRLVDRVVETQVETWAYCGSGTFRTMEYDGSFSPLGDYGNFSGELRLPDHTSLFLYWDPKLYNTQYKSKEYKRRVDWDCLLNTGQIQTALLYHNHVIGGTAKQQEQDGRGSKHAFLGPRLRDARVASA